MVTSVGKYEPNITCGLTLPVLEKDKDGNVIINMRYVASHEVVDCGEETPEMVVFIKDGWLIKHKPVSSVTSKEKITSKEE